MSGHGFGSFTDIFSYIERTTSGSNPHTSTAFPSTLSLASDDGDDHHHTTHRISGSSFCASAAAMSPGEWMMRRGKTAGVLGSHAFEEPSFSVSRPNSSSTTSFNAFAVVSLVDASCFCVWSAGGGSRRRQWVGLVPGCRDADAIGRLSHIIHHHDDESYLFAFGL